MEQKRREQVGSPHNPTARVAGRPGTLLENADDNAARVTGDQLADQSLALDRAYDDAPAISDDFTGWGLLDLDDGGIHQAAS
jgi:hypothetical protein